MQKYHGYRYFDWKLTAGVLEFSESEERLGREKKIEGKYVVMTGEKGLSILDAVALYKELTEVESGFRQLKDVMALRPIYHQIEMRVKAHIFVAALALLVQRLLGRRLKRPGWTCRRRGPCKHWRRCDWSRSTWRANRSGGG